MPEKSITDGELYRRFLDGDDTAFTELVEAYQGKLTFFIENLVGNHETAEDIAIDVFAALLVDRKPLRSDTAFQTFLFSIGKNLAFKHLRRAKKHAYAPLDNYLEETIGHSARNEAERAAEREHVHRSLRKLKADHRCVLYLLFFEEMSYAGAGIVMKKTEGQIRGLASCAKQSLKRILESEGFKYAEQ